MNNSYQRSLKSYELVLSSLEKENNELKKSLKELKELKASELDKKNILMEYSQEYIDKVNNNTSTSASIITRYRTFIHQLDALISEQTRKINLLEERNASLVKELAVKYRKMKVLKELIKNKMDQESDRQEKVQQVVIDDMTARNYQVRSQQHHQTRV